MENQDIASHSEEPQGGCSNKKAKLESDCIQAPSMGGQVDKAKSTTKKNKIQCYKCKEYVHKCSACPNWRTRKQLPTREPCLPFLPIICFNCGKVDTKLPYALGKRRTRSAIKP